MKPVFALIAGLALVAVPRQALAGTTPRPNVLLICIDDLRPDLGCYGNDVVQSPNIDRLSASGVTFDRCYVQVAACNPSRASFLTGLRPDTLKCWTLQYHFRETKPDAVTLPQYLRQQGYHAEGYGKIFHNPWQDPRSWSIPHRWGEGDWFHYDGGQTAFIEKVRKSLAEGAWQKDSLRGPVTNDPDIQDDQHPDGDMARIVAGRLQELKGSDKPFFLAAGFVLPHLPWCPPKKYWDIYKRDQLLLAKNPFPPTNAPAVALGNNYEFRHYADCIDFPTPLSGTVTEEEARRFVHGYFASVSFVDAQIGKILAALKQQGLEQNTIVVLWPDHGYKLGEHNGWGKMTNFETDTRIPLIIRDPRARGNGRRSRQIVEALDVYPPVCELAGVPIPDFVEGQSAARLLDDPEAGHRGAAYSEYIYAPLIGCSVRTKDWRYTEWREMSDGAVKFRELYDHRTSHEENDNIAASYPDIADELQRTLGKVVPARPIVTLPEVHSTRGGKQISVTFVNRHAGVVRMSWINPKGSRALVFDIPAGQPRPLKSFVGHVFAAESLDGRYVETVTIRDGQGTVDLGAARKPDGNPP